MVIGGPPVGSFPLGGSPQFVAPPQFLGAPGLPSAARPMVAAPQTPAPPRFPSAAPAAPAPIVRAKGADEPLSLPSPEQLGLARGAELDWNETRRTLSTLGATDSRLELLASGEYRFSFVVSASLVDGLGATPAAAVRAALARVKRG
jgi:hypothetical protein